MPLPLMKFCIRLLSLTFQVEKLEEEELNLLDQVQRHLVTSPSLQPPNFHAAMGTKRSPLPLLPAKHAITRSKSLTETKLGKSKVRRKLSTNTPPTGAPIGAQSLVGRPSSDQCQRTGAMDLDNPRPVWGVFSESPT